MARQRLSRADLLLLGAVLSAAGAAVSGYLVWEWYAAANSTVCDINNYFSCTTVRHSVYSSFLGIPTATVGLSGFLILFALFVLAFRGTERLGPWPAELWLILFASLGALVGLGLSFIEVFIIQAVCIFCAAGFALDLGALGIAVVLRRRATHEG
jgi:uncharacterized membrane protein